jgi:hypothetical protein
MPRRYVMEAMEAGGVSPAAALEPWAVMREDIEAAASGGSGGEDGSSHVHPTPSPVMQCAARAAATAARCVRLPTGDVSAADGHNICERHCGGDDNDEDDDGGGGGGGSDAFSVERDELGEGLRDIAVVVGAENLLPLIVEGLTASVASTSSMAGGRATAEGWIYALFATARLVPKSPGAMPAVAAAVAAVSLIVSAAAASGGGGEGRGVHAGVHHGPVVVGGGGGVTTRGVELAVWVVAGLARALSVQPPHVLTVALGVVVTGLGSSDASVVRGSCVAAMRVCETCADVMANGGRGGGDGGGGMGGGSNAWRGGAELLGGGRDSGGAQVGVSPGHTARDRCGGGGEGDDLTWLAMEHLTEVYRRRGPVAPPLRSIRRGQEPVTTILARALAAVAQARDAPSLKP